MNQAIFWSVWVAHTSWVMIFPQIFQTSNPLTSKAKQVMEVMGGTGGTCWTWLIWTIFSPKTSEQNVELSGDTWAESWGGAPSSGVRSCSEWRSWTLLWKNPSKTKVASNKKARGFSRSQKFGKLVNLQTLEISLWFFDPALVFWWQTVYTSMHPTVASNVKLFVPTQGKRLVAEVRRLSEPQGWRMVFSRFSWVIFWWSPRTFQLEV